MVITMMICGEPRGTITKTTSFNSMPKTMLSHASTNDVSTPYDFGVSSSAPPRALNAGSFLTPCLGCMKKLLLFLFWRQQVGGNILAGGSVSAGSIEGYACAVPGAVLEPGAFNTKDFSVSPTLEELLGLVAVFAELGTSFGSALNGVTLGDNISIDSAARDCCERNGGHRAEQSSHNGPSLKLVR